MPDYPSLREAKVTPTVWSTALAVERHHQRVAFFNGGSMEPMYICMYALCMYVLVYTVLQIENGIPYACYVF